MTESHYRKISTTLCYAQDDAGFLVFVVTWLFFLNILHPPENINTKNATELSFSIQILRFFLDFFNKNGIIKVTEGI